MNKKKCRCADVDAETDGIYYHCGLAKVERLLHQERLMKILVVELKAAERRRHEATRWYMVSVTKCKKERAMKQLNKK